MERFDITIIGAGVVGLAIASELPQGNNLVIERHEGFGKETSSRNSEVVHAGIYYPTGFLKTRLCVEGNELIYRICKENNINYKKLGKIIVATTQEEADDLERVYRQGVENGVPGLRIISSEEIKRLEPNINAVSGIYSPTTGIVDTHSLMKHFESKAKSRGVIFAYGCELVGAEEGYKLTVRDSDGQFFKFMTDILINCAGLCSDKVAGMLGVKYKLHYCKGEYFKVGGGKNRYISHLIYPHPTGISLGIHTVLDLQGQLKLGPNAFYVDKLNYDVDPDHATQMWESARMYLPFIELKDLSPDMSGIRPKLQGPGEPVRDFVIREDLPRFINLIGIESPGLTASPAIARYILGLIHDMVKAGP